MKKAKETVKKTEKVVETPEIEPILELRDEEELIPEILDQNADGVLEISHEVSE